MAILKHVTNLYQIGQSESRTACEATLHCESFSKSSRSILKLSSNLYKIDQSEFRTACEATWHCVSFHLFSTYVM